MPALLVTLSPATSARADNSPALLNEALDKPVALDLNDVLPAALRAIEAKTGVPIKADAAVWDMLPWGEQTNLAVKIQNQTLRQALTAITQRMGLSFVLADGAVVVRPVPAARRMPLRATALELQALDTLASHPAAPGAVGDRDVQAVVTAIDAQLEQLKSPFAVENRLAADLRAAPISVPRNATMLEALEAVAKQTRATWYPWGKSLVVVPKETQVRDQLSLRLFTARHNGADIAQVLEDLSRRSGLDFLIDPGALQKIPPDARNVRVVWENASVARALESLKGVTGLDYQVTDKGLTITNPSPAPAGGGAGSPDPVFGQVTLPGGMIVFIRESQVPADIRQQIRQDVQARLDDVWQKARLEARPVVTPPADPATRPATRPGTPTP